MSAPEDVLRQPKPSKLRIAAVRMLTATGPVGTLAFWHHSVEVEREDRDLVCDALLKILREHPELEAN